MCRKTLTHHRIEGQENRRNVRPRGEPLGHGYQEGPYLDVVVNTKGCGDSLSLWSVLEFIWVVFTVSLYTIYTVIMTWTSDTIFQSLYKLTMYGCAFGLAYALYCCIPYAKAYTMSGVIGLYSYMRQVWRRILRIEINPLVWISIGLTWVVFAVVVVWLAYDVKIVKDDVSGIHVEMSGIQYNVSRLQTDVIELGIRLTDVENGLDVLQKQVANGFERMGTEIKELDAKMVQQTDYLNEKYSSYIEGGGWVQTTDTYVRETMYSIFSKLSSKTITRSEFGLGCFLEGTKIQIDKDGNTVNVEDLKDGDFVYSKSLDRVVPIKILFSYGEETGTMYEITTGSFSVVVTKTHPMKLCRRAGAARGFDCDENIAAEGIHPGNWTQTVKGYQKIVSVEKISVDKALVYNFMLDVDGEVLVTRRDIIADGIVTLDLEAQKQHH
eukprot:493777_1